MCFSRTNSDPLYSLSYNIWNVSHHLVNQIPKLKHTDKNICRSIMLYRYLHFCFLEQQFNSHLSQMNYGHYCIFFYYCVSEQSAFWCQGNMAAISYSSASKMDTVFQKQTYFFSNTGQQRDLCLPGLCSFSRADANMYYVQQIHIFILIFFGWYTLYPDIL